MSEAEILFEVQDGLGVITLNRPKALKARTHGMILELERVLPGWEKDAAIKAVVVRGAGDRAFCAGGDVIGLYREMRDNPSGTLRRDFFRDEHIVNRRIYRYAKPWISLIAAIDMVGGIDLSPPGSHSVAEIEAKLRKHPGEWANKQLAALMKLSPLSMAITLEQLRRCANRSFEDTMTIEYRMAQHAMRPDHDFFEGVRALLIDKDHKPKWNPPTIEGVTRAMVEAHFKPVANDLLFD